MPTIPNTLTTSPQSDNNQTGNQQSISPVECRLDMGHQYDIEPPQPSRCQQLRTIFTVKPEDSTCTAMTRVACRGLAVGAAGGLVLTAVGGLSYAAATTIAGNGQFGQALGTGLTAFNMLNLQNAVNHCKDVKNRHHKDEDVEAQRSDRPTPITTETASQTGFTVENEVGEHQAPQEHPMTAYVTRF